MTREDQSGTPLFPPQGQIFPFAASSACTPLLVPSGNDEDVIANYTDAPVLVVTSADCGPRGFIWANIPVGGSYVFFEGPNAFTVYLSQRAGA